MSAMTSESSPPPAIVKVPILRQFGNVPPKPAKVGRGYSVGEVRAVGLTVEEARLLGIYVDERRRSVHEHNIERLREWLKALARGEMKPPAPALPKILVTKLDRGRVFKGKTTAGRRMRGLLSVKYRYTHHYKWGRKLKERALRKRHEATRHTGGD